MFDALLSAFADYYYVAGDTGNEPSPPAPGDSRLAVVRTDKGIGQLNFLSIGEYPRPSAARASYFSGTTTLTGVAPIMMFLARLYAPRY